MGLFAANSGSSETTSAEGSDDDHIEENGKLFLRPVLLRSFFFLWCCNTPYGLSQG